jgi:hypothetical protein
MNPNFQELALRAGIHFAGLPGLSMSMLEFQPEGVYLRVANDGAFACDAQPSLVTVSNAGIPVFLTTYIDPNLIKVLVAPMNAVEVIGNEVKKGDWLSETALFPVVESTGEVSSYGDYSNNGQAGANTNFPNRQAYLYQVITQWGERELERMGLAKVDWANQLNVASALTLSKFQNKSYFYGVAGLENFGLLNDPGLSAPITPTVKAAGGTAWEDATALEVYADVQKIFREAQQKANGLIDLRSEMTLAMSPTSEVALTKTTEFNVNVSDLLKKNFPNMTVKTAPEYETDAGQLVQLIINTVEGQRTVDACFTEKMRAHPIVVDLSSFKQKKTQGTWGSVVYRPIFITGMIGV